MQQDCVDVDAVSEPPIDRKNLIRSRIAQQMDISENIFSDMRAKNGKSKGQKDELDNE